MVLVSPDTWKLIERGTYDKCMTKAMELGDSESWMVVRPAREHYGTEVFTITK